jgi:hypothetical protein
MMGAMMWMMRGKHANDGQPAQPDPKTREEIAMLRAEVASPRAQQTGQADRGARS